MIITHAKVSQVPSIPGAWVQPTDWNAQHVVNPSITQYTGNATVPLGADVVEANCGGSAITLTLTNAGAVNGSPIFAMKVDSGAGAANFVDSGGASFLGPGGLNTSYSLVNIGQWAIFIWDSARGFWMVFGV
jgi:hypothetical protein